MSLEKAFWVAVSLAIIACAGLITFILVPDAPSLGRIVIFISAIVCLAALLSAANKKVFKVTSLSILVFLAAFAATLNAGTYESMSLMQDSWIDTSHCAMIFHIRNNGLTRWHILQVQVNNITFSITPFSEAQISEYVERGADAYLLFYYCEGTWQWIPSNYAATIHWSSSNPFDPTFPEDELKYKVNSQFVPSTFIANSTYQVTFYTGSMFSHTFKVPARATLNETLCIQGYLDISKDLAYVSIEFNNTGSYYSYIYLFQINNVTFHMDRFFPAPASTQVFSYLGLNFHPQGFSGYSSYPYVRLNSDGNLTSTDLEAETSVNVTAITMANHVFAGQLITEAS
jgi:hypothetical protein